MAFFHIKNCIRLGMQSVISMAPWKGLEPLTYYFGGNHSIHLSYQGKTCLYYTSKGLKFPQISALIKNKSTPIYNPSAEKNQ